MTTWQRLADIPDHITEVVDRDGERTVRVGWMWKDEDRDCGPSSDGLGPFTAPDPEETPVTTTPEIPEGYSVIQRPGFVHVRHVDSGEDTIGSAEDAQIREVAAALIAYADQQDREQAEREAVAEEERGRLIRELASHLEVDLNLKGWPARFAKAIDAGWRPGGAQ